MSERLDPSQRDDLQHLDQQLGDLIDEVRTGKQDTGRLFYIGQQLSVLMNSKEIPDDVKVKLGAALSALQSETIEHMPVYKLIAAKHQIDDALGA